MSKVSDNLRAEQSRAEQSRAEQSRAEQSRAEQSRAEQSRAEQSRAEQTNVLIFCGVFHTGYRETVGRRVAGMPPVFRRFFCCPASDGSCRWQVLQVSSDDAKTMCTGVEGRCQQKLTTPGTTEV